MTHINPADRTLADSREEAVVRLRMGELLEGRHAAGSFLSHRRASTPSQHLSTTVRGSGTMCIVVRTTKNPHAEPADERQRYEQRLMRIGRKLQSTGQLLEQAPARIVGKGFPVNPEITGERPVQIELDELRDFFDSKAGNNIGQLLHEYHELLARLKRGAAP